MAASSEKSGYSAEVHFAQRLAANEKKTRDRAVKKLRQWISVRSQSDVNTFSEGDLLKIWKGLFYCMWMSDKPLIQEDLAETIANLIHAFKTTSSALMFVDTFYQTMGREWLGIDRFRLDKFYMLVRRCLYHSFEMLKRCDWDPEAIDAFVEMMKNGLLNPDPDKMPDGLVFHVTDIYLGELTKVGGKELSPQETLKFVEPYCQLAAKTPKLAILRNVVSEVFRRGIIYKSDVGLDNQEDEEETGKAPDDGDQADLKEVDTPDENAKDKKPAKKVKLAFDYQAISDCLYKYASDPKVLRKMRTKLYVMVKKFQDLAQGIYPVEAIEIKLQQLIDEEEMLREENRKKQKKGRRRKWRENKTSGKQKLSEEGQDSDNDDLENFSPKSKIRKKSNKRKNAEPLETMETVAAAASTPEESRDETVRKKKKTGKKGRGSEKSVPSERKDEVQKVKDAEAEVATVGPATESKGGRRKRAARKRSAKGDGSDSMDASTDEGSSAAKAAKTQPFAQFEKVTVPSALVRKGYKKLSQEPEEKTPKIDPASLVTPPHKKKVEFALSLISAQDPKEYKQQVKKSPLVPFDKEKKPKSSVLKTPEPVATRRSTRKRKKVEYV